MTVKRARLALMRLSASGLPTEFRIFKRGQNSTTKGTFLFDDEAAKAVMAEYKQHGVDLAIDLEHLSLDDESQNYDPDARGWCRLELRQDGSLWAVNVRWTPDGARRLKARTQRYISPVFSVEKKTKRIVSVFNIAICAVPATDKTPALVAASRKSGRTTISAKALEVKQMNPELKKIAARLGLDPETATLEDIESAIAALESAAEAATAAGDEPGEDDEEASDDSEGDDVEASAEADDGEDDDGIDPEEIKSLPKKLQGRIMALSSAVPALRKDVAALKKSTTNDARERLIAANADKLPLKLEKWARKAPLDTLREYFANAVPVRAKRDEPTRAGSGGAGARAGAQVDVSQVKLTAADYESARIAGITPAKQLERKKKLIAARAEEADRRRALAEEDAE